MPTEWEFLPLFVQPAFVSRKHAHANEKRVCLSHYYLERVQGQKEK